MSDTRPLDAGTLLTADYVIDYLQASPHIIESELSDKQYDIFLRDFEQSLCDRDFTHELRGALAADDYVWKRVTQAVDGVVFDYVKNYIASYDFKALLGAPAYSDVVLNKYHTNAKIKFHELPEENMARLGFRRLQNRDGGWYWSYYRGQAIAKDKQDRHPLQVGFYLTVNDGDGVRIDVVDDDFGQPYDYQRFEAEGRANAYTQGVRKFVEEQLAHLQNVGVLSGHEVGEYV